MDAAQERIFVPPVGVENCSPLRRFGCKDSIKLSAVAGSSVAGLGLPVWIFFTSGLPLRTRFDS